MSERVLPAVGCCLWWQNGHNQRRCATCVDWMPALRRPWGDCVSLFAARVPVPALTIDGMEIAYPFPLIAMTELYRTTQGYFCQHYRPGTGGAP